MQQDTLPFHYAEENESTGMTASPALSLPKGRVCRHTWTWPLLRDWGSRCAVTWE